MTAPVVSITGYACPCCRDGITSQREVLAYKRVYLRIAKCVRHLEMFDAANAKAEARERREDRP